MTLLRLTYKEYLGQPSALYIKHSTAKTEYNATLHMTVNLNTNPPKLLLLWLLIEPRNRMEHDEPLGELLPLRSLDTSGRGSVGLLSFIYQTELST